MLQIKTELGQLLAQDKCDNFSKYPKDTAEMSMQDPPFIKVKGPNKDVDAYIVEVRAVPSCVSTRDIWHQMRQL